MHNKLCGWLLGAVCAFAAACGAEDAQPAMSQGAVPSAATPGQPSLADAHAEAVNPGQTSAVNAGQAASLDAAQATTLDAGPGGSLDAGQERGDAAPAVVVARDATAAIDDERMDAGPRDATAAPFPSDAASDSVDSSRPAKDAMADRPDTQVDEAGGPHVFKVDSKAEWTPSGFRVDAGKCYAVKVAIDDRWLDLDVPADLNGWLDHDDLRLILFQPFRRVTARDIGFYQFATCVDRKLDQCFPVSESTTLCPRTAGELFFFVNDVPGFEDNNVGTATVSLQPK